MSESETYLTPEQVSERWNRAVNVLTLRQWRYLKRGPPYTKIGSRRVYALSKLIEWEQQNTISADDGKAHQ